MHLTERIHELRSERDAKYRSAIRYSCARCSSVPRLWRCSRSAAHCGIWPSCKRTFPTTTAIAGSARWTRRRRSTTRTTNWPSRSSRNSGSKCRSPEVSPHLVQAMIAIEDQRFYEHGGFDVLRMASAALANLRERRAAQGGSTITQQLARQSFLTPDKTIRRKLQELILAARIEATYSKDADPRALPEQGVFRRRAVRRRGGVARLLRQARVRAVRSPRRRCWPAW